MWVDQGQARWCRGSLACSSASSDSRVRTPGSRMPRSDATLQSWRRPDPTCRSNSGRHRRGRRARLRSGPHRDHGRRSRRAHDDLRLALPWGTGRVAVSCTEARLPDRTRAPSAAARGRAGRDRDPHGTGARVGAQRSDRCRGIAPARQTAILRTLLDEIEPSLSGLARRLREVADEVPGPRRAPRIRPRAGHHSPERAAGPGRRRHRRPQPSRGRSARACSPRA